MVGGNSELQYYTDRTGPTGNARIENNQLIIEAREEDFGGNSYTSARITTKDKQEFLYGRFEARIKIPLGQGIWPAFWMLGNDFDIVGWPNAGEIDIMENRGDQTTTLVVAAHGPGYSGGSALTTSKVLPFVLSDNFHIYSIEWEPNRIQWYIDDIFVFEITPDSLPTDTTWVYDKEFYFLLNIAVGGTFPGSPDLSTSFPQQMIVDYVRVYQRQTTINNLILTKSTGCNFETHTPSVLVRDVIQDSEEYTGDTTTAKLPIAINSQVHHTTATDLICDAFNRTITTTIESTGGFGDNVLSNFGFESDLSGWDTNAVVNISTSIFKSGAKSAELDGITSGDFSVPFVNSSDLIPCSAGDVWDFQGYMYIPTTLSGINFGILKIVFRDGFGSDLIPEEAIIGSINFDFPGAESAQVNTGSPSGT